MISKEHPFISLIKKELDSMKAGSIVLDVGTSKKHAKDVSHLKKSLKNLSYYAFGYQPKTIYGKNSCDISADIHALPVKDGKVDILLNIEVIEHVRFPRIAVDEMHRVLKKGGVLILTTPFLLPYHGKSNKRDEANHENYPDLWRFTHQGLEELAARFSETKVFAYSTPWQYYVDVLTSFLPLRIREYARSKIKYDSPKTHGSPTTRHLLIARK